MTHLQITRAVMYKVNFSARFQAYSQQYAKLFTRCIITRQRLFSCLD